jgi:hypothetical protein
MLVYVDDIVIAGSTPAVVDRLVRSLSCTFPIKDLGPLEYFLGLEASYNFGGHDTHSAQVRSRSSASC